MRRVVTRIRKVEGHVAESQETFGQTPHRARECVSCGYDLDDRVLVDVELEVRTLDEFGVRILREP